MNREIKFRAWVKRREMMYPPFRLFENPGWTEGIIDPSEIVLMQFTGLNDKNGKEIWEGDIVNFNGNMTADNSMGVEPNGFVFDETSNHAVEWSEEHATWDLHHYSDVIWKYRRDCHLLLIQSKCEVIGNIYENPELQGK